MRKLICKLLGWLSFVHKFEEINFTIPDGTTNNCEPIIRTDKIILCKYCLKRK